MSNPFYVYYEHLTFTQKKIYSELLPEIEKASRKISVRTKCRSQDVFDVIPAIMNDHPEIFWMTGKSQVWTRNDNVESVELEYNALAGRLSYHKELFRKAADRYLKPAAGKSVLEQERLIHDKMVRDIDYVPGKYDQTAYSSLVLNQSVCAGYSRGFQYLMQRIGVPCYYCRGKAKNSKKNCWEPHSWNILKLSSDFYVMDITWDDCYGDTTGAISYTYYNCSDDKIAADHIPDKACSCLPRCSGRRYSFEKIYGMTPELAVILQDGVTCRSVLNGKTDFLRQFVPEAKKGARGTIQMSFPSQNESTYCKIGEWIEEVLRGIYGGSIGWKLRTSRTDYKNGWYRIEFILTFQK